MKFLVVGAGGREHAIAWKLAQSEDVDCVYVAPGNAGTAMEQGVQNINITQIQTLADFAEQEKIHLTIVGPEAPLAAGIVDVFQERALPIFGPTRQAAQLESSKDFAKRFMVRHKIPTAAFESFTDAAAAHAHIDAKGAPIVIKADGLAAGKGVVVAMTPQEAHNAVDEMLVGEKLGSAGGRVVIEEFLQGEEASFIVMTDGKSVLPLVTSQDHKRLQNGDEGPNTGGMGAYSPAPIITPEIHARVLREIIMPAIRGMELEGAPYTGFLYAGLIIGPDGTLKTLEFNCRLGDPETQPIMMRLKSDLAHLFNQAIEGKLAETEAEWDRRTALGIVLAAANYPETPRKGDVIHHLPPPQGDEDYHVFHAGTAQKDGRVVTNGGRVLCVTALGENVRLAQRRAYDIAVSIIFDGRQMRTDIGTRAVNRQG